MSGSTVNNVTAIALSQKNQAGVTKYFTALPTLTLAGVTTTAAKINAVFQADIDASSALDAAEADVKQKRAAQKAYILGNYGEQAVQMLVDCGFDPPKPRGAQTVAAKAQAVAQGKATREARGTKGTKQKAAIKGVVATPAAEPAPAPATPPPPVTK